MTRSVVTTAIHLSDKQGVATTLIDAEVHTAGDVAVEVATGKGLEYPATGDGDGVIPLHLGLLP